MLCQRRRRRTGHCNVATRPVHNRCSRVPADLLRETHRLNPGAIIVPVSKWEQPRVVGQFDCKISNRNISNRTFRSRDVQPMLIPHSNPCHHRGCDIPVPIPSDTLALCNYQLIREFNSIPPSLLSVGPALVHVQPQG